MKSAFNKLACHLFGHRVRLVQRWGVTWRFHCRRCDRSYAVHDDLQCVVEWDEDIERIKRLMGYRVIEPLFSDGEPLA